MKMKDEKQKHNHKLTDLIKVCIFGLLMIAPLLASISQMLYVTLNKNAKDSYYGETINQETTQNVSNKLYPNIDYELYTSNIVYDDQLLNITLLNFNGSTTLDVTKVYRLNIYKNAVNANFAFYYYDNNNTQQIFYSSYISNWNTNPTYNNLYVKFRVDVETTINDTLKSSITYQEYNKYSYLDNAFYYGVDQMTKSELFNWTQNTAIYTGVKAMTDNLQIQTPAIAILIVYWFILTIIYVIIDIVLKCFTTITHMIFRAD